MGNSIVGYYQEFGKELTRTKAKKILSSLRLSDNNVKIGEAIANLEYAKKKDDILKTLKTVKNLDSGAENAERLYEIVLAGEFEGLWNDYLKGLKMEISMR